MILTSSCLLCQNFKFSCRIRFQKFIDSSANWKSSLLNNLEREPTIRNCRGFHICLSQQMYNSVIVRNRAIVFKFWNDQSFMMNTNIRGISSFWVLSNTLTHSISLLLNAIKNGCLSKCVSTLHSYTKRNKSFLLLYWL